MISCGGFFTVCVDDEGFIWSFGVNNFGQLGIGNKTSINVPQKLQNIPPVVSVVCGSEYTLMITSDSNLWSCGNNDNGQLCHGEENDDFCIIKPRKTSFSNITKISAGYYHSLFQNDKGEIFACGYNDDGEVDWVILIILKSHQVSFSIYLQTLLILLVEITKVYFLTQKEMYILLGIMAMGN